MEDKYEHREPEIVYTQLSMYTCCECPHYLEEYKNESMAYRNGCELKHGVYTYTGHELPDECPLRGKKSIREVEALLTQKNKLIEEIKQNIQNRIDYCSRIRKETTRPSSIESTYYTARIYEAEEILQIILELQNIRGIQHGKGE